MYQESNAGLCWGEESLAHRVQVCLILLIRNLPCRQITAVTRAAKQRNRHNPTFKPMYLLIAWPLWYRSRRTIKVSLMVCVVVWVLALVISCFVGISDLEHIERYKPIGVILLLPFPVLIFSVVGIIKGLSAAISVSSEEKRRIVGATILVLLNYTLLFLPFIIGSITPNVIMTNPYAFICFNPLGVLVLYVFMRKGAIDKILASLCCCRMETQQQQTIAVNDKSITTVSSV
ncbi:uncharacterized protein LOC133991557 [Scomber scombrus]|uniref:uncharacterized protein LOC133991557 n=1 Tax=Scomber scombrus TaxID=13677 RepID=UPI002DDC482E|nr:uncharacterized protein LOC133991557 [Scomber scombrus]